MEPHDEPEIGPDDYIIRRINPDHHVFWDSKRECYRIKSTAFKPSSYKPNDGMSVDIEAKIIADGINPKEYVTTPEYLGSVRLRVGAVRDLGLWVGYHSLPDNPYHGEVWGPPPRPNRFSKQQIEDLRQILEWHVELPGVEIR